MHLPAYLADHGLPAHVAVMSLALIGLFNIIGTYATGWLGGRMPKRYILSFIYFGRAVVIALFVFLPLSAVSVYAFAIALGLLWLSTVPPTNGIVAQVFGVRYLAMLSGFTFFSHQIGSFLGAWLGGKLYDTTGSYDVVWYLSIALGVVAGADQPADRRAGDRENEGGRSTRLTRRSRTTSVARVCRLAFRLRPAIAVWIATMSCCISSGLVRWAANPEASHARPRSQCRNPCTRSPERRA